MWSGDSKRLTWPLFWCAGCNQLTDSCLSSLKRLSSLTLLDLRGCQGVGRRACDVFISDLSHIALYCMMEEKLIQRLDWQQLRERRQKSIKRRECSDVSLECSWCLVGHLYRKGDGIYFPAPEQKLLCHVVCFGSLIYGEEIKVFVWHLLPVCVAVLKSLSFGPSVITR